MVATESLRNALWPPQWWPQGHYDALCGPIDAEISAPELVATSDLCPHQDLVYTAVTTCSAQYMRNVQEEAESFSQLRADREMLAQIAAHSWIVDCKKHAVECSAFITTSFPWL